jgi:hypothetical protein
MLATALHRQLNGRLRREARGIINNILARTSVGGNPMEFISTQNTFFRTLVPQFFSQKAGVSSISPRTYVPC